MTDDDRDLYDDLPQRDETVTCETCAPCGRTICPPPGTWSYACSERGPKCCQCSGGGHRWDAGSWGVIVGVSACALCGATSRVADFDGIAAPCGCDIVDQGADPRESVVLHAPECERRRR